MFSSSVIQGINATTTNFSIRVPLQHPGKRIHRPSAQQIEEETDEQSFVHGATKRTKTSDNAFFMRSPTSTSDYNDDVEVVDDLFGTLKISTDHGLTSTLDAQLNVAVNVDGQSRLNDALAFTCSSRANDIVDSTTAWSVLMKGLKSQSIVILERAVQALSAIISHTTGQRGNIMLNRVSQPLLNVLNVPHGSQFLFESCVGLLTKFLELDPTPPAIVVREWTPYLFYAITDLNPLLPDRVGVISEAVGAVKSIIRKFDDTNVPIHQDVFKRLIELTTLPPTFSLVEQVLGALGSVPTNSRHFVDMATKWNLVGHIGTILKESDTSEQAILSKKEACRVLGTLVTSTPKKLDALFSPEFQQAFKSLCELASTSGNHTQADKHMALSVIVDVIERAKDQHILWLCFEANIVIVLCRAIDISMETKLLLSILVGLYKAVNVCHRLGHHTIVQSFQNFELNVLLRDWQREVTNLSEEVITRHISDGTWTRFRDMWNN